MYFSDIINAAISKDSDRPLMQKDIYPVSNALQQYLEKYKRDVELPINYSELFHYQYTNAIKDKNGKPTHWENVIYEKGLLQELKPKLLAVFGLLNQTSSDELSQLDITAIDFCEFANSMPFRITVNNRLSNQSDFFYIKTADASRIYGLELEQLISPNKIVFYYHLNTLVETHIDGMPGDNFLEQLAALAVPEQKQLAMEFVRFNERCFARLLGDMRSYNFVVLQDKDQHWRMRAIDFDQQCYEGRMNLYLPQFYKENYRYVQLANSLLDHETIERCRILEREQLAGYVAANRHRLSELLQVMQPEEISENYKIISLRKELATAFQTSRYSHCKTMGCLVKQQLKQLIQPYL